MAGRAPGADTSDTVGPRLGQRRRVLGTIALAALPLLLLAALSLWQSVADLEASIVEQRVDLARAAALAADAFVSGNLSTLQSLALTRDLRDPTVHSEVGRLLDQLRDRDPNWDVLGLSDRDGWNIAITGLPPRTVNIAPFTFFQQVMSTGRPVISPAFVGRVRGIPLIALAVPVEFADGGRGILSGSLSLERLGEQLRAPVEEQGIRVVVLDSEGKAFIHPDPEMSRALVSLRDRADVAAALAGETGSDRVVGAGGQELLVAHAPVPSTGWVVLVQQPTTAAFDVVRRQLAAAVILLGVAAALTGLIGWRLGDRLTLFYRRQLEARAEAERVAGELQVVSAESEGQRRFLEDLIATAPVAIAITSGPDHRYVTVNARYQAVKPDTPMLGRTVAEVFPEGKAQGTIELLDRARESGESITVADRRIELADATGATRERYFTSVLSRYDDANGRPDGVLLVILETTEVVLARRQIEREKDEFLSIASHELKTPLTSMRLAAQMIGRMLARGSIDRARLERHVGTIDEQVRRATLLIGDLLDVSRIDSGRLDPRRELVDLVPLVKGAVQRHRDALPDDSAHEIVDLGEESSLPIAGDEARLDQVLTNLLSNAVKYSPNGGRVEVRLAREDGTASLTIADQGMGIPVDERGDLFAPFSRTDAAKQSGVEGTGLGLYISRRIVEAHDGTIAVEDTPGGGTTFRIRLPLEQRTANVANDDPDSQGGDGAVPEMRRSA